MAGRGTATWGTIRTVVGVTGVLVQGDDLHALLPVQVVVQLLGRAPEPGGSALAAFAAAAAAGPAQVLALQGSGRSPGRGLGALQRPEDRELGHRQGGQAGQGSGRRGHAGGGGGGRRSGGGRGRGGGGERGRALAEAVGRGLGSVGRLELGEGPAALELAALREELLPVLQIGGIYLQESGSAGVAGLQHRAACGAERKGDSRRETPAPPRTGRPDAAAPLRARTRRPTRGRPTPAARGRRRDRPRLASPPLPGSAGEKPRPEEPQGGQARNALAPATRLCPPASLGARAGGQQRRRAAPHARGRRASRPGGRAAHPVPGAGNLFPFQFPSLPRREQTTHKVDNREEETSAPRTDARVFFSLRALQRLQEEDAARQHPTPGRRYPAAAPAGLAVPGPPPRSCLT